MRLALASIALMGCASVDGAVDPSDASPSLSEIGADADAAVDASDSKPAPPTSKVDFRTNHAMAFDAASDAKGALYFAGLRYEPVLTGAIWKIDATGAPVWSTHVPDFMASAIAVTTDGGAVAVGCYRSSEAFTPYWCEGTEVVRVASDGAILWSHVYPLGGLDAVAVSNDTIYIGGSRGGSTTLGSLPPTPPDSSLFLAAFSLDGTPKWARGFHSAGSPDGHAGGAVLALAYDAKRAQLVVGGRAFGTLDLGDDADHVAPEDEGVLHARAFVAGFDTDGVVRWSKYMPSEGDAFVTSVDVSNDGAIVVGGVYATSIRVDGQRFPAPYGSGADGPAGFAFVALFDAGRAFQWLSGWGFPNGSACFRTRFDGEDVVAFGHEIDIAGGMREWHAHTARYGGVVGALLGELRLEEVGMEGHVTGALGRTGEPIVVATCDESQKKSNAECSFDTDVVEAHP